MESPGESLDDVLRLIGSARWLENLGRATTEDGLVAVTDEQFRAAVRAANASGFGLPADHADRAALPEFEWLDEELEQLEQSLKHAVRDAGLEGASAAARKEAIRLALASLRDSGEPPLLKVGPTNTVEGARQMALISCRVAATEAVLGQPGMGYQLLRLFHRGQWPFGRAESGDLLVL